MNKAVEQQVLATERLRNDVVVDILDDVTLSADELVGMAAVASKLNSDSPERGFYSALLRQANQLQEQLKRLTAEY
uniref:Uncharacterized protein n=1 Tax=viral metagenome TaxID=1070528 RepID=A0A6M3KMT9_9ZZZZ